MVTLPYCWPNTCDGETLARVYVMEILLKNLLFVIPFSIVVLLVPACFSGNFEFGLETGQNADLQAGGEFYNSQHEFRIVTPKDWVVPPFEKMKLGAGSIGYAAFDPSKSAQVNVFVEDLSSIDPPMSLEEYVRINKSNAQINSRFEELARRKLIIDENIDAWEILWTRESPKVDGEKGKWLIFLKEGNGFVINAFSDEPLYEHFDETLDTILVT